MFKTAELRDEAVILMLQLNHFACEATPTPAMTGAAGAKHIEENQGINFTDSAEFDTLCMSWCIATGSEAFPVARKLAIGRVIATLSYEHITEYQRFIAPSKWPDDSPAFERFIAAMLRMSSGCNFDRIVDWYLYVVMRTNLGVSRLAYLLPDQTPMRMITEEYRGEDTNRIVGGFRSLRHQQRFEVSDWATEYDTTLYITCLAMLRETIDDVAIPLCINNDIVAHAEYDMPTPFVLTGAFAGDFGILIGYVYENAIHYMPQTVSYPVPRAIMAWADRCDEVFTSRGKEDEAAPFKSLHNALHEPDRPLVGDKYVKFFRA